MATYGTDYGLAQRQQAIAIVDEMSARLGGSGGDANAANQQLEIDKLGEIFQKLDVICAPKQALGGFNPTPDIPVPAPLRSLTFTNNSSNTLYLQIHDKNSALITGDVPYLGYSLRIPSNATLILGALDFGLLGTTFGNGSQRIGISSTFETYTPANTSSTSFFAEFTQAAILAG